MPLNPNVPIVFIATPTRGQIEADTVADIFAAAMTYKNVMFQALKGTYIGMSRDALVVKAHNSGASHILFIDSDMTFPSDTISRLLAHERWVVGANYRQRFGINDFTAYKNGDYVSSLEQTGLEEVDFLGFGVVLINLQVLAHIQRPWFETGTIGYQGEDVSFCERVRKVGMKVFIDHDLSQEVGHLTQMELKVDSNV